MVFINRTHSHGLAFLGEHGSPMQSGQLLLSDVEDAMSSYGYNVPASDAIALNRTIKDTRHQQWVDEQANLLWLLSSLAVIPVENVCFRTFECTLVIFNLWFSVMWLPLRYNHISSSDAVAGSIQAHFRKQASSLSSITRLWASCYEPCTAWCAPHQSTCFMKSCWLMTTVTWVWAL